MADHFAGFTRGDFVAMIVDQTHVVASEGLPTVCSLSGSRGHRGCTCRRLPSCRKTRSILPASAPAHRLSAMRKTARWCRTSSERRQIVTFEFRPRHHALILHRHQHRMRCPVSLGERKVSAASNFSISTTVPPRRGPGKTTSVVLEYSGVDSSVTHHRRNHSPSALNVPTAWNAPARCLWVCRSCRTNR